MKLLTVTEAAEKLGVSKQTLVNWNKRGIINIKRIGEKGARWVDADTIEALAKFNDDVKQGRKLLKQELVEVEEMRAQLKAKKAQIQEEKYALRQELCMICKTRRVASAEHFYLAIPQMLCKLEIISPRDADIMQAIIRGEELSVIAQRHRLNAFSVRVLFARACKQATELSNLQARIETCRQMELEHKTILKAMVKIRERMIALENKREKELREKMEAEQMRDDLVANERLYHLLQTNPYEYPITTRVSNTLKAAEVMTLGDVAQYEECDLMKFRNFGKKSVLELKSLLESQGLHLGMDVNAVITKHMALMMIQAEDEY